MTTTIDAAQAAAPDLSRGRLYAMHVGYPLMGSAGPWSSGQPPRRPRVAALRRRHLVPAAHTGS